MFLRFASQSACVSCILVLILSLPAQAEDKPHWVEQEEPKNGKPHWIFTAGEPGTEGNPSYETTETLDITDIAAEFEVGAVLVVTDTENPVGITRSDIFLSWSGIAKDAWLLENEGKSEMDYIFSNYGGFIGAAGPLDVIVNDSTFTFCIAADELGGIWYIDGYNIHVTVGGATVNIENGIVAARQIDDIVGDISSGGNFTKTGNGILLIGGSEHDEADGRVSGLNMSGRLTVAEGTLILAGDREEGGGATTFHQAGQIVIEGESAVLDIKGGVCLQLTGDEEYDLEIYDGGTLRAAAVGDIENSENNPALFKDPSNFHLEMLVDGGTVHIYNDGGTYLDACSIDTTIGENGGTINVDSDITFVSGSVSGDDGGNYTKMGAGTHIINGLNIDGGLVINEGTTILNGTGAVQQAGNIVIEGESAVLDLHGGLLLGLTSTTGNDIAILGGGTLRAATVADPSDNPVLFTIDEEGHIDHNTQIFVDGGTVHIYNSGGDFLDAQSIDTVIGANGGIIIVDEGILFESRDITSTVKGTVVKAGQGVHHILGNVHLGNGTFAVQEGEAWFSGDVKAGALIGNAGTTIVMAQDPETTTGFVFNEFNIYGTYIGGGFDLTIGSGTVMGEEAQMTGVGHFTAMSGVFTLEGGKHSVQTLTIDGGNFNLTAGTELQITNAEDSPGIVVQGGGLLTIDAVSGAQFTKEGDSMNLLMQGGSVNIVNLGEATGFSTIVNFSNISITLGEFEQRFNVEQDITLVSSSITGVSLAEGEGPGHYTKQGYGTHEIYGIFINGTISVEQGSVLLHDVGTKQTAASVAVKNSGTLDIQSGVELTLTSMMSIEGGGVVTNAGLITTKTLFIDSGGTLRIQTTPNVAATAVSTETLILENGAKIDVGMEQLQLGTYSFENLVTVTGTAGVTDAHLATLNSHQTALRRYEWRTGEDRDSLNLMIELLTVQEYTQEIGWTQGNVKAVAGLIDQHIGDRYLTDEESGIAMEAAFSGLSASSGTVNSNRETLENLTGHTLNGELRSAMAGELVGNAARIAMSSPHRTIFRHLETNTPVSRPAGWLGQAKSTPGKMQLWFTPYAQSEKGEADDYTFDGYTLTRAGLMIGGDMNLTQQIVGGLVFQYGNPSIKSDLGKITADDFMVGAYMKMTVYGQVTLNAMIAYGMQQYSYQGPGSKAAFDGDAIFGSLELTSSFTVMSNLIISPIVGVDFQSLGMDDLTVPLPTLGRMAIQPEGLDTTAVRIGLQGECFRARARAQYIRQVGGNDYMMSTIGLGGDMASLRSVQWGKDWVNVGLGCDLGQLNKIRFAVDYDCDISKNTTSHLGSVKAVVTW